MEFIFRGSNIITGMTYLRRQYLYYMQIDINFKIMMNIYSFAYNFIYLHIIIFKSI